MTRSLLARLFLTALALLGILLSLWHLRVAEQGMTIEPVRIGTIPATVFTPTTGTPIAAVVIAHGFAGSGRLMRSFATTLARNGYVAVTFDFAGHGRNPEPLTGSITEADGATGRLVAETAEVTAFARGLARGRLALLGHSMASDIVVRSAIADPGIAATIAVSMFSPVVTATEPRDLLIITGDWEGMLKREALRVLGPDAAPFTTYGSFTDGTARRAAFATHVEHVGVLFSRTSQTEALAWLDQAFAVTRPPVILARGPWIALLIASTIALAWPLSRLLPTVAVPPVGADLPWRRMALPLLAPMLLTPPILRVLPTHFLPVLVGDYLAVHFAVYGLITAACFFFLRRPRAPALISRRALVLATLAVTAYGFLALIWPVDRFFTSLQPGLGRAPLILALLVGTLAYFLSDEWATRGPSSARGAAIVTKLAFLVSLGLAVALDFERLFFLVILLPIILPLFLVFGLISGWIYARTGHPFVAAIANAVLFAWAIGSTFPLLAG